jgi:cobalt-zinc-cadmium efflux system outer membrane protein
LLRSQSAKADTVTRTLQDEEKLFLQNNFTLLAAKYEISVSDAAIIQAKLYPNPGIFIDQGLYNKSTGKWLDVSKTGQTAVSLQQVILLAGKRNKAVALATIGSKISAFQFFDLIRTLRFELHSVFYDLYYQEQSLSVFDKELAALKSLTEGYAAQYNKGNIAFRELARLQALQFELGNERLEILSAMRDDEAKLKLLTGDTGTIRPAMNDQYLKIIEPSKLVYASLLDSARMNRYDLLSSMQEIKLEQANLALQKSLKVPDLTLGLNYDKAGSYIPNYNSISLAIGLPLWNRNQGNIKMSEYRIKENQALASQAELTVNAEVNKAYAELLETDSLYRSYAFSDGYEKLLDGITKAYQEHTISLLEFIDYYTTYKDSKTGFNALQAKRLNALENLDLATGSTLFK